MDTFKYILFPKNIFLCKDARMKKFILLFGILLSGCATLSQDVNLGGTDKPTAKLLVYRDSAFQAGGVGLYIGKDDQYFIKLRNDEYAQVDLAPGTYVLQAKAGVSPASEFRVKLPPNSMTCIVGKPNTKKLIGFVVPWSPT